MGYHDNVYDSPEKYDLTIVEVVERPDLSYEFDMAVLFRHKNGRYFWATDSGCSCPIPFEEYTSVESLTPGKAGWDEAKASVLRNRY